MTKSISVMIADDHVLFREGIRKVLEAEPGFQVLGEAGNGSEAVRLADEIRPDVMLLDVQMPGNGASFTVREVKAVSPRTVVIIVSMSDERSLVRSLIEEGVRGYLLKSVTSTELVMAIRSALVGTTVTLAISANSMWHNHQDGVLSHREREVLELTAQALSNSQIADRLVVAEATVKRHLHNAFRKLGAVSRIDAVNKAKAASLITAPHRGSAEPPSVPTARSATCGADGACRLRSA
jgi:DNA-binding NarL/FixJ family response regulator